MPKLQALLEQHMVVEVVSGVNYIFFSCCVTTYQWMSGGAIRESMYRSTGGVEQMHPISRQQVSVGKTSSSLQ